MSTVRGAFATRELAAAAVDRLIAEGFEAGQVSVLDSQGDLAEVTPEGGPARRTWLWAGYGAVVGGVFWALGGMGIAPGLVLGPVSFLPGALIGALAGALLGLVSGRRRSAGEVARHEERTAGGAYVVSVDANPGEQARARTVLAAAGAEIPLSDRDAGTGG